MNFKKLVVILKITSINSWGSKTIILYLDIILDQLWTKLWAQKAKKRPKTTLQNQSMGFACKMHLEVYVWHFLRFHQMKKILFFSKGLLWTCKVT